MSLQSAKPKDSVPPSRGHGPQPPLAIIKENPVDRCLAQRCPANSRVKRRQFYAGGRQFPFPVLLAGQVDTGRKRNGSCLTPKHSEVDGRTPANSSGA